MILCKLNILLDMDKIYYLLKTLLDPLLTSHAHIYMFFYVNYLLIIVIGYCIFRGNVVLLDEFDSNIKERRDEADGNQYR